MSLIDKGLTRSRTLRNTAVARASSLSEKGIGFGDLSPGGGSAFGDFRQQAQSRRHYTLFRGWVHAAIHAIAEAAASQPARLGRVPTKSKRKAGPGRTKGYRGRKSFDSDEIEMINSHGILDLLAKPNPLQHHWQYVYSFVANLALTGFGYLVAGKSENGLPEVYSLPSTWVRPQHDDGPFSSFKIVNPANPGSEMSAEPLTRDQVAFAYIPDPSNPLAGLPPSQAQSMSISIDDKIQTSQQAFFDNGIFPSVVVTIGKNPHPDIPGGGLRPRLSAKQRRQITAAIRKVQSGVSNYGNPAIVDGLVERIDRLSNSSTEMGWERSEASAKKRILSAFGVHPFILGEEIAGSEAQARIVKDQFYDKVNTFLSLFSGISTEFVPGLYPEAEDGLQVWYEPKVAVNPQTEVDLWKTARSNGDVTQNEFRNFMQLPPDLDLNPTVIEKQHVSSVLAVAAQVNQGALMPEQALALLEGMGLPTKLAERIVGDGQTDDKVAEQLGEATDALGKATLAFLTKV